MNVTIVENNSKKITLMIEIQKRESFMDTELAIQAALNEGGRVATGSALGDFDTDGDKITCQGRPMTSKGLVAKEYQAPYGVITVRRHVYQSSHGGATFCPLEQKAHILETATPLWAKQAAGMYARMPAGEVLKTLEEQGRHGTSRLHVQRLGETVAECVMLAETRWDYEQPGHVEEAVASVAVSIDGTSMLLNKNFKQAMVGTLSLHDEEGKRLETIYVAALPQEGKEDFLTLMERELGTLRERYPDVPFLGLADGATDNWGFLCGVTDRQTTDYWHAVQYLEAGKNMKPPDGRSKKSAGEQGVEWFKKWRDILKDDLDGAERCLKELKLIRKTSAEQSGTLRGQLESSITYFENQKRRMNYAANRAAKLPIGSGVVEAACKTIVKQRMCVSGARWKDVGAKSVLKLRALERSECRWEQFWSRYSQINPIEWTQK